MAPPQRPLWQVCPVGQLELSVQTASDPPQIPEAQVPPPQSVSALQLLPGLVPPVHSPGRPVLVAPFHVVPLSVLVKNPTSVQARREALYPPAPLGFTTRP
jgi:hypothetical protein